jgi:5'-nucleotidase/UDP-sugar diphosphatase
VSGIRFSFDPSKPAGSRLLELLSYNPAQKCFAPVDDSATYNVISNDFTAGGGDGFSMFATSKKLLATGPVLADVLAEYIQNFSPINIQVTLFDTRFSFQP